MQELSIPMNDNVIERIMYNKEPTRKDMVINEIEILVWFILH